MGSNYEINVDFDSTSFYKLSQTKNGSRIGGEAVKMGSSVVTATYKGLTASAELLIYASIELTPALVTLPYDPNNHRRLVYLILFVLATLAFSFVNNLANFFIDGLELD